METVRITALTEDHLGMNGYVAVLSVAAAAATYPATARDRKAE
jgi:hypothetical protein